MENNRGLFTIELEKSFAGELKVALMSDVSLNEEIKFIETYDDNATRGVSEFVVLTLALVPIVIPTIDSTLNITERIKDFITKKIQSQMNEINLTKQVITKFKISLPFLSYEREEHLLIAPQINNKDDE